MTDIIICFNRGNSDSSAVSALREVGLKIANEGEEYASVGSKLRQLRDQESEESQKEDKIAVYLRHLTEQQVTLQKMCLLTGTTA